MVKHKNKSKKSKLPRSLQPFGKNNMTVINNKDLFIVVIGSSAGGLETLKIFFSTLTEVPNLAFVIITHLSPDHVSLLPTLVQSFTPLKVLPIENNQEIKANHVYILPPAKIASIQNGILKLTKPNSIAELKMPIDYFLRSFAIEQKKRGIFVILSGTGSDGTIGLRVLREQGGLVIVQNASSARYDGMPKSAINTGLVDYILTPEKMCPFILDYTAHFYDVSVQLIDSVSKEIHQILQLINKYTGHDFSLYKPNTIFRRIQKRMNILQIDNLSHYIQYLRKTPSEIEILFGELLINVTNFFRDPEAFEILKKEITERISNNKMSESCLRVWVPGCSTGEEVYSIAILIQECMDSVQHVFNVQIFGTDIDDDAIEIARAGIFSPAITKEISPERLERFFVKEGDFYKINIDVRKMIIFAKQNLVQDPPFTKLDLLSCRNLLIYLTSQLQKKILPLFHYSLKPKGLLFLGTSETIGVAADLFTIIDRRWKIFERKGGSTSFPAVLDLPTNSQFSEVAGTKMMDKIMYDNEPKLLQIVEQILLKNHTPPCVVIDDKGNIVYIYGKMGRFLEFAPGEVRLNFYEMVLPQLKNKVSLAIRNATSQQKEIIFKALQFKDDNEIKYINLIAKPIFEAEVFQKKLLLIIFEEIFTFSQGKNTSLKLESKDEVEKKILQLDQELKYTKESLQTTIEELETSNEELKSSNEELQSTNEELQSTNEEIETSKEELQSLNEELTTVNAELESRIEQLSSANDDIRNLLDNTEIATVFLDKDLCIKRFTPKATEIINLISSDVGRPISHIVSNLQYDNLVEDARKVLHTLDPKVIEVIDKNNHWFVVRIIPYKTVTNIIDGVVITFLNIHAQKKAENNVIGLEKHMATIQNMNHSILDMLQTPAILINNNKQLMLANKSFLTHYNLKMETIFNKLIAELQADWDEKKLNSLIDEIIASTDSNLEYKIKRSSKYKSIVAYKYPPSILICFNMELEKK